MNKDYKSQLIKELRVEGATPEEERKFLEVIHALKKKSEIRRSESFKRSFLEKLSTKKHKRYFSSRIYIPALLLTFILFVLIAGAVSAQKSLPGQPLYPVKILSENIIKTFNPSFSSEVLKRRSEEIKSLSEQRKNSDLLQQTLENYSRELDNKNTNNVKTEELKKNLEKAKEMSAERNKEKIEKVIEKTENKILETQSDEKKKESTQTEVKALQNSDKESKEKEKKNEEKGKNENGSYGKKEKD